MGLEKETVGCGRRARRVRRPASVTPRASRIVIVAEVPRSEECFPQGYMLGHSEGFQFQGHGTLDRRLQFVDY